MIKFLTLFAIVVIAGCASNEDILWPKPANLTFTPDGENMTVSPCEIRYIVESPGKVLVDGIINHYLKNVFKCSQTKPGAISINVVVRSVAITVPTEINHEEYSLVLRNSTRWELTADYYPGFLRAFETYSQLFQREEQGEWTVYGLPITITDRPEYIWRQVLIDTARHFLKIQTILDALDAMMYAKLNVLHWHITDEDAFPLYVPTVPELSQAGSVGGVYSEADVQIVINYARTRGIRVIPEIDTPAHSQSWGRSQKYKSISMKCWGGYGGQLNPTVNLTWQVVENVLKYINSSFTDEYVHFGGDEVIYSCWNRTDINQWMKQHGIDSYKALSVDFREKQKQLWRGISSKKKVIYWANEEIDLPLQDDDVIQWWGVSSNVNRLVGRPNQVILSNYDITYLDVGFGSTEGDDYLKYEHWRIAYSFQPAIPGVNVIGGASCMWNEIGNDHTFQQKVLQRASVIGERLWNSRVNIKTELRNIATRLHAHGERLRQRGFKVWPVTVGICEKQMSICF